MSDRLRGVCSAALSFVADDVYLRHAGAVGVRWMVEPDLMKEVVTRWPEFLVYARSNGESPEVLFDLPAGEVATKFIRALAREAMN